jgi:biotin operon repressor
VFHRWYSSAIFVDAVDDNGTVAITSQHRGHGSSAGYMVRFDLGSDDDDLTYNIKLGRAQDHLDPIRTNGDYANHESETANTQDDLMDLLRQATGSWLSVATAAAELGITDNAVRKRAARAGLDVSVRRINGRAKSAIRVPEEPEET